MKRKKGEKRKEEMGGSRDSEDDKNIIGMIMAPGDDYDDDDDYSYLDFIDGFIVVMFVLLPTSSSNPVTEARLNLKTKWKKGKINWKKTRNILL